MPNLDLRGFNSGAVDFSGLYKTGDDMFRNKQLEERKEERLQKQKDDDAATLASNAKFLQNTFDPKQHLTGSLYDPVTTKLMGDAYSQALTLAQQKVPLDQILMATQPLVSQINDYTQKATMYTAKKKEFLDQMKNVKGYDSKALSDQMDKEAFYDQDENGQLKLNVDKADPTQNYGLKAIQDHPELVTNSSGLEDIVKTYKPSTFIGRVKRTNAKGGYEMRKTKVVAPAWTTIDDQGDVVPKFQIAKDGDNVITHEFTDENGKKSTEPVRLLDDKVFHSLLSSDEGMATADWLKGELKKAGVSTDLNSTQANHAARAILYTELKNRTPVQYDDIEDTKANPIPKVSVSVNNAAAQPQTVNLYGSVDDIVSAPKKNKYQATGINQLPSSAQKVILEIGKNSENDKNLTNADFYLDKSADGTINLWRKTDNIKKDYIVAPIDPLSLNVPANIEVLKTQSNKGKVEAMKKVDLSISNKTSPDQKFNIKGKSYTKADLNKLGYTDEQISQAQKAGTIK